MVFDSLTPHLKIEVWLFINNKKIAYYLSEKVIFCIYYIKIVINFFPPFKKIAKNRLKLPFFTDIIVT